MRKSKAKPKRTMTITCKEPPRHPWELFARKYGKLTRKYRGEKNQWKRRALALEGIIKRAQATPGIGSHYAILAEADKIKGAK